MRKVKRAPPRPWFAERMADRLNSLSGAGWTAVSAGQHRWARLGRCGAVSAQHRQGRFSWTRETKCLRIDILAPAPNVYRWMATCSHLIGCPKQVLISNVPQHST